MGESEGKAPVKGPERVEALPGTSALAGRVEWAPARSLWTGSMALAALLLGPLHFSWSGFALFVIATGITLLCGHSVGLHRRLIHASFRCPLWLERLFVYLATLVGLEGPLAMVRTHDLRDWAQRQPACHDYFCHRRSFFRDAWWQLHCRLRLEHPPQFRPEPRIAEDRFYAFLQATWIAQQLPWAILSYALGGMSWLVWGVAVRVTVGVTGHWLVGHFAHREGGQSWLVEGAAVQGYNVAVAGLVSMGESWHNNHHAFPGSARLGLFPGEPDPGWWLIRLLAALGLAADIKTPEDLPPRPELKALRTPPWDSAP